MASRTIRLTEGDLGNIAADAYIVSSTGGFSGGTAGSLARGFEERFGENLERRVKPHPAIGSALAFEVPRRERRKEDPTSYLIVCANTGAMKGEQDVATIKAAFKAGIGELDEKPPRP